MSAFKVRIALEEVDFLWDQREVFQFRELWKNNYTLLEISKKLKRKQIEVAALIVDQVDKCKIHNRKMGLGEIGEKSIRNKKNKEIPPYVYIALEEVNFIWKEEDIKRFKDLWKKRFNVEDIANRLRRHQIEIAALILDQFDLEYMLNSLMDTEKRVA
ncbi:sugar ABC transporter substrate-binding protein [Bacillus cereus]|uniref:sugar ABC transporter substrate-binding protein n=1 Tax=Bacillus cereus TaxID=1396 RepID=UPI000BECD211|nr:sugar ABC transporter substrate-binding protein [Bacillus cereus]PDZ03899.1 sugar ABC transporter substrate-binding protein [Bacillus cereus]PEC54182.1 sugar ABC transporter substrate-binding protein [Bacillus cereus]PFE46854.1 sugar ABC transporter substrate-binding protein [Bacillus cereus]PFN16000.1 sugar ABC transporter substrate-binding protein [Bacillus cereus]